MTEMWNTERESINKYIESTAEHRYDIYRDPDELIALIRTHEDGNETIYGYTAPGYTPELTYSRWAMTQLLNRFKVPLQFYDRCSPDLKTRIFDEHVTKTKNKRTLLLRMDPGELVEDHETRNHAICRAVLTRSYGIIDDPQIFPPVLDVLEGQGVTNFTYFRSDEHLTQLITSFPDCSMEYGGIRSHAGIIISNSETGHGAVWIEPAVLAGTTARPVHFVNRSVLKLQGYNGRIIHKGEINIERVQNMARQVKDIAQVGLVQLAEAWENRVDVSKALKYAKSIDALPERIYSILEEEWSEQQELARALVAQRIMEAAQTLPLFQRTPVEQAAGRFIGLFVNYRSRMQQIIEEISE